MICRDLEIRVEFTKRLFALATHDFYGC